MQDTSDWLGFRKEFGLGYAGIRFKKHVFNPHWVLSQIHRPKHMQSNKIMYCHNCQSQHREQTIGEDWSGIEMYVMPFKVTAAFYFFFSFAALSLFSCAIPASLCSAACDSAFSPCIHWLNLSGSLTCKASSYQVECKMTSKRQAVTLKLTLEFRKSLTINFTPSTVVYKPVREIICSFQSLSNVSNACAHWFWFDWQ